ncbi:hypothetical protein AB6A40_004682 [Gnathostoma spinigerum]|uniref:Uncharacterized protein n=1 Tax=Gnathostoma spinigerum TaxID=75299 RepID=A0ABD6EDC9_9BILA
MKSRSIRDIQQCQQRIGGTKRFTAIQLSTFLNVRIISTMFTYEIVEYFRLNLVNRTEAVTVKYSSVYGYYKLQSHTVSKGFSSVIDKVTAKCRIAYDRHKSEKCSRILTKTMSMNKIDD